MEQILDNLRQLGNVMWSQASATDSLSALGIVLLLGGIMLAGLIGGFLSKKIRMPLILGYIIAGIAIGALKIPFVQNNINGLANIGVALLLFSMGLEFEKRDIAPIKGLAIGGTLFQVFFSMLACTGVAYWVALRHPALFDGHANWTTYFIFGATFVSTSTAVVLKTLINSRQITRLSAKVMVVMSIVQDLTVIPLFLLVTMVATFCQGSADVGMSQYAPLILMALFFLFALILFKVANKLNPLERLNNACGSSELFLLALLLSALAMGFLADRMQVSFSFGAFLAGVMLSDSPMRKKAVNLMAPVRDLFALVFFVSIGTMFRWEFCRQYWGAVLAVTVLTGLSRTVPLALVSSIKGYKNIIPLAMLFGMFPTSEIAFVITKIAYDGGYFPGILTELIVCSVVLSMLVGPAVDALTAPSYKLVKRLFSPPTLGDKKLPVPSINGQTLVIGEHECLRSVAAKLRATGEACLLVDQRKYETQRQLEEQKLNDVTAGGQTFYGKFKTILEDEERNGRGVFPKMIIVEHRFYSELNDVLLYYHNMASVPVVVLLAADEALEDNEEIDTWLVVRNYKNFYNIISTRNKKQNQE